MVRNDFYLFLLSLLCQFLPTLPNVGIGKRHEYSYYWFCANILVYWEGINKRHNADSDNKAPR